MVSVDDGTKALKVARRRDAELPIEYFSESGVGPERFGSPAVHVERSDEKFPGALVEWVCRGPDRQLDDRVSARVGSAMTRQAGQGQRFDQAGLQELEPSSFGVSLRAVGEIDEGRPVPRCQDARDLVDVAGRRAERLEVSGGLIDDRNIGARIEVIPIAVRDDQVWPEDVAQSSDLVLN